jgi:hypothetical protein
MIVVAVLNKIDAVQECTFASLSVNCATEA